MNYLVFDTEQTYNYGYIVVNEAGETLHRMNLVLTNNFENRNLIGENTYKRKKVIYEKDPDAKFVGSAEGAAIIARMFKQYNISYIISHNNSEDKRQLELLSQQTGITFPNIPFYDSIDLVKILFPNNTQRALKDTIEDITGIDIKQTHTALQDCDLIMSIIVPIIEVLPYFIKYKDIFAHDNDYEITEKFFSNITKIMPFPRNVREIQEILGMNDTTGNKKIVNNFLKRTAEEYSFFTMKECVEYSEKTGKPLKTPGLEVTITNSNNKDDFSYIAEIFTKTNMLADMIITSCVKYQASQETDEMITAKIEKYKSILDAEYKRKEEDLKDQEARAEKEYQAKITRLKEIENSNNADYQAKMNNYKTLVANTLARKIGPIVNAGLFSSKEKNEVKRLLNTNPAGLFDYFMR